MKLCSKCKIEKSADAFGIRENGNYTSHCKSCKAEYLRKRRSENKEVFRERDRKWSSDNLEKILLRTAKNRSKRDQIPFDLDLSDISIPEFCPIFGIPLFRNLGNNGPCTNSPSLDKIIPSKGYVKGNVQVISHLANTMKSYGTLEQLVVLGEWAKIQLSEGV